MIEVLAAVMAAVEELVKTGVLHSTTEGYAALTVAAGLLIYIYRAPVSRGWITRFFPTPFRYSRI